ncbi:glycoside hydrolase family 71/99-like protein [Chloroflexota bacterium]
MTGCTPEQGEQPEIPTDHQAEVTDQPTRLPTPKSIQIDLETQPDPQNRPLILVHYMPWYQTPSGSGYWGWHWTMNHYDPKQIDRDGKSPIASHYYPLTGPYDSGDQNLFEYQVMLMKLSGIDGVIVDWYGFEGFWDDGKINSSTHKLFEQIKKTGLLFAITYEDRTIQLMLENGYHKVKDPHVHGQQVMEYLQENWFQEDTYLKVNDRPVMFVFGNPPYYKSNSDWVKLFSVPDMPPYLITQDGRVVSITESRYPWPPMHLSGGGELSPDTLENYLENFYDQASNWDTMTASVFPGFHDIYNEAGVGPSYGYLDSQDGETLDFTFQKAFAYDPDIIQVVTWNDYGEGTSIEPAVEYGYQYLEMIQDMRKAFIDDEFPFTYEDLTILLKIYDLRKEHKGNTRVNTQLDEAFRAVLDGKLDIARVIISNYQTE